MQAMIPILTLVTQDLCGLPGRLAQQEGPDRPWPDQ